MPSHINYLPAAAALAEIASTSRHLVSTLAGEVISSTHPDGLSSLSFEAVVHGDTSTGEVKVSLDLHAAPNSTRPIAYLRLTRTAATPDDGEEIITVCLAGDKDAEVERFLARVADLDPDDQFTDAAGQALAERFDLAHALGDSIVFDETTSPEPAVRALSTYNVHVFTEVRVGVYGVTASSPAEAFSKAGDLLFHDEVAGRSKVLDEGMTTASAEWTEGAPISAVIDPLAGGGVQHTLSMHVDSQGYIELEKLNWFWSQLSGVATNCHDEIVEAFLHFAPGTHRELIWKWFEESNPAFSVARAMGNADTRNSMKIIAATLEPRIRLVAEDETVGVYYREVHPDQPADILDSVGHDYGMAPGYFYSEDGTKAFIGADEDVEQERYSLEVQSFIAKGWANMTFAGIVWVAVVQTDSETDPSMLAMIDEDKTKVERFVSALNWR